MVTALRSTDCFYRSRQRSVILAHGSGPGGPRRGVRAAWLLTGENWCAMIAGRKEVADDSPAGDASEAGRRPLAFVIRAAAVAAVWYLAGFG